MATEESSTKRKTAQTRVWEEQAVKLGWLFTVKGIKSADFIGQRIAADLDAEFEQIRPLVKKLEAAKSKPVFAPDFGGES
jgi:hypothetical protein